MSECCICLNNLNELYDIRLNCCQNFIHKNCFNNVLATFLECPICREFIYLELPTKKKYYLFNIFNKKKKIKKVFLVESQKRMIYNYS
jgi:hypothetical protein